MPPQDPQEGNSKEQPPKKDIDLGSILLPKKETPGQTPESAQRINAGALLEQEQQAAELGTKPQEAPQPASAPAAAPKEESVVQPLETYKSDIERLVQDKNVSVVSIAAAEAQRRSQAAPEAKSAAKKTFPWRGAGMLAAGVFILAVAAGLLAYAFAPRTIPEQAVAPASPFIYVDGTEVVPLSDSSRNTLMESLTAAQQQVSLSLGLIERLIPAVASTTANVAPTAMDAQTFLSTIAPDIPQDLLRNIDPSYLLGVHVYDGNQAFLILKVDSYESAYSGMLAWEPTLEQDLSPLFSYTPEQHIPEEGVATTTPAPQVLGSGFQDAIVENQDARVLENSTGDIYFLWTFLDRNTLVITTNDATLREIISRLNTAPVTPIPGE